MTEIEKQIMSNYVNDMTPEEAQILVRLLPAKLMSDELARRERVKSNQISAINLILSAEELF